MINRLLFALICLGIGFQAESQTKNFDLVILINEKLPLRSTLYIFVEVNYPRSHVLLPAQYYPGNLAISDSDFVKSTVDSVVSVHILLERIDYANNSQKQRSYDIKLTNGFLKNQFNVIYVYDLDLKKYRRTLDPILPGKNYTYEFITSHGSLLRVRKQKK